MLVKFPSGILIPTIANDSGTSGMTIGALGDKCVQQFYAPKKGSITSVKIDFSPGLVGTATVSIQGTDGTGFPDGTPKGSATITNPTAGLRTVTFGSPFDVAYHDQLFLVVEVTAYTSGSTYIAAAGTTAIPAQNGMYCGRYVSSAWSASTNKLVCHLVYSDGDIPTGFGLHPAHGGAVDFKSDSATDEYGNRFVLPFTCLITALWAFGDFDNAFDLKFYSGDNAQAVSLHPATRYTTGRGTSIGVLAQPMVIPANQEFIVSIRPTTTSNVGIRFAVTRNNHRSWGMGGKVEQVSRADGGAWTTDATRMVCAGPHITGISVTSNNERWRGSQGRRG